MKIFLIVFLLISPFFAKEIKKENQQKSEVIKTTKKKKTKEKQDLSLEKSSVFKDVKENNLPLDILEIKPSSSEQKYNLNTKYSAISKYKDKDYNYESDYKLGLNYELDKETGKLEKLRFDVETKFKGIN
jgi:hypothetical protein